MALHGLLLIDKGVGLTSHDVVARVRRIINQKEVGHTGTLDPMASGLMVLVLGEGAKLSNFILEGNKAYELELRLGIETDTLDITGQILKENPVHVLDEEVLRQALQLQGDFEWSVPLYSAKKINGQKLYEYARKEQEVEIPKKHMKFWGVEPLNSKGRYAIHCSKGSYIRSWISELGRGLGCGATMTALRRTISAPYSLEQAQNLESLQEERTRGQIPRSFIPLNEALIGVKKIALKGPDLVMIKNGQISHDLRRTLITTFQPGIDQIIQLVSKEDQRLLAIVGVDPDKGFVIRRGFNAV